MSDPIMWSPGVTLEQIEKQVILKAFSHFRQNKTTTANSLGIDIKTLYNKLEKYDLDRQEEEKRNERLIREREEFLQRARGNPPNNIGIPFSPFDRSSSKAASSFGVEPITNSSQKHAMPLPESKEVQGVLSKSHAKGDSKKTR